MVPVHDVVAYSAQIACIVAVASVLPPLLRLFPPGVRYTYWRAVALLCLVLPWLQGREQPARVLSGTAEIERAATKVVTSAALVRTFAWAPLDWPRVLAALFVAGIIVRLVWIFAGLLQLRRLRRAGVPTNDSEEISELQRIVGARAELRYVAGLKQPVTFGAVAPVVLLPDELRSHPLEIQRAILVHELFHVQRHDWSWIVVEELICAVLWFNPAAWWVISQIQRVREEIVDELAVLLTGHRRSYVEALLAFADRAPFSPAPAFARRRHLFRRIVLISREDVMSSRRIVVSCGVMALVVALGSWWAVEAFPLQGAGVPQPLASQPGPLERRANPITPENPIPRRVAYVAADYPEEAASVDARGTVTLRVTIDQSGRVSEVRAIRVTLPTADLVNAGSDEMDRALRALHQDPQSQKQSAAVRTLLRAFIESATTAVRQWQYDPPARAPIAFTVTFTFSPGVPTGATQSTEPSGAADAPSVSWTADGAVRVGGNIRPPTKIKDVRPAYPDLALQAHVSGVVVLEARIEPDGHVSQARILRSIPLLDQAAIDAVRQWEFRPTVMNGNAVPVIMTVTVNFAGQ